MNTIGKHNRIRIPNTIVSSYLNTSLKYILLLLEDTSAYVYYIICQTTM